MGNATVRFNTAEYRKSHGAEPRGFGSWAFCLEGQARNPTSGDILWVHQSKLGDAKKVAKAHFAAFGDSRANVYVAVLP